MFVLLHPDQDSQHGSFSQPDPVVSLPSLAFPSSLGRSRLHVALDVLGLGWVQVPHMQFPISCTPYYYAQPPSGFLQFSLPLPARWLVRFPSRPILSHNAGTDRRYGPLAYGRYPIPHRVGSSLVISTKPNPPSRPRARATAAAPAVLEQHVLWVVDIGIGRSHGVLTISWTGISVSALPGLC